MTDGVARQAATTIDLATFNGAHVFLLCCLFVGCAASFPHLPETKAPPARSLALIVPRVRRYPVIVPTPTPAYNSTYSESYLVQRGQGWKADALPAEAAAVAGALSSDVVRGYVRELAEYIADALAVNPKVSLPGTSRTALFGLQTTPLNGQFNYIRCGAATTLDDVAPHLFPFVLSSAWPQLRLSINPANPALVAALDAAGIGADIVACEDDEAFNARMAAETPYNVIIPSLDAFPLVGQFCSLLLCVGHIKSTQPDDTSFVQAFSNSPKWLAPR